MAKIFGDVELPSNFANKLLNCEIEVELNEVVPKNVIMTILQLYSKGMEYFESIRSYKYMYFERKMNSLLRCPKIINSMENKQAKDHKEHPSEKLNKAHQGEEKMRIMEIKQKYEKMHEELMGQTSSLVAGGKIKKIVAQNEVKFTQVKASIQDQLTQQEERLKLKIQRRKFQKATKKCLSAVDLEKSTKDSLFNDSEGDRNFEARIQSDFSTVIQENQDDSQEDEEENQLGKQLDPKNSLQNILDNPADPSLTQEL